MIYDGLRVADLSTGIAGAYCAKLLTDLGAEVVNVEPPGGDPLRVWSASGNLGADGDPDGALFRYLTTSQRSVTGDPAPWVRWADIVIESFVPGEAERLGLVGVAPVTVSISALGRGGPDSALVLPEEVLQARSGSLSNHGYADRTPLTVGGRLGEWVTGAFAALGAVTAWRRASRTGTPEHVDVSMLEAMQCTLVTTPTLMARFPGGHPRTIRMVMIPGIHPTKDDAFVGITTITMQQWTGLLHLMGRDDLASDDELANMLGRHFRAAEVIALIEGWTTQHPAAEIVELCRTARVPASLVGSGEELPHFEQMVARHSIVAQPDASFTRPRAPFRISSVPDRVMTPAPRLGEGDGDAALTPESRERRAAAWTDAPGELPLAGVRVVDFTAFYSGPFATSWLAAMGADVVKIEAVQRPDGIRLNAAVRPHDDAHFYEKSGLFHAINLNKRDVTLDLNAPEGLALARRLIATADVVAENFTPRVMDGFGLGYDQVRAIKPDIVMLRLPAFGLEGPWRDLPGFAQTMEQLTGMAWVTGYNGGPPIIPGGVVDPLVGVHAATGIIAALEHRDRTGEPSLVEMPMFEVAAAVTAEQVVEYSAYGALLGRRGEGGVYACAGEDSWVAIDRGADPLSTSERAAWCATRDAADVVAELAAQGVAAAVMVPAYLTLDDVQMRARGFFQRLPEPNPLVGDQEWPTWPVRFSAGPSRIWTRPAPTLGRDNAEILGGELGVSADELAALEAQGVIGTTPRF